MFASILHLLSTYQELNVKISKLKELPQGISNFAGWLDKIEKFWIRKTFSVRL